MTWLFWAGVITISSTTYQLCSKMLAGSVPVFFITACVGSITALASILMLSVQPSFSLEKLKLSPQHTAILILFGIAAFGIEVGFNQMYRAGAPLSIARMVTTGGTGLILVLAAVAFFNEKLSTPQIAGVFMVIAGLTLMSYKVA